MPKFVVEMPHTPEQCSAALGTLATEAPQLLDQAYWGCKHGTHTGWAIVDAGSESELRNMISPVIRDQAKITEVDRFSAGQIREMHRRAA